MSKTVSVVSLFSELAENNTFSEESQVIYKISEVIYEKHFEQLLGHGVCLVNVGA